MFTLSHEVLKYLYCNMQQDLFLDFMQGSSSKFPGMPTAYTVILECKRKNDLRTLRDRYDGRASVSCTCPDARWVI